MVGGPSCGARAGPTPLGPSLAKWTLGILAVTSLHRDPAALELSLCLPGNPRPFVPAGAGEGGVAGRGSLSLGPPRPPPPGLPAGPAAWASVAGTSTKPGKAHRRGWRQETPREAAAGNSHPSGSAPTVTLTHLHRRALEGAGGRARQPPAPSGPAQRPAHHPSKPRLDRTPPTWRWTPPAAAPSARPPASVSACPRPPVMLRTSPPAASAPATPWTGVDRDPGQSQGPVSSAFPLPQPVRGKAQVLGPAPSPHQPRPGSWGPAPPTSRGPGPGARLPPTSRGPGPRGSASPQTRPRSPAGPPAQDLQVL